MYCVIEFIFAVFMWLAYKEFYLLCYNKPLEYIYMIPNIFLKDEYMSWICIMIIHT